MKKVTLIEPFEKDGKTVEIIEMDLQKLTGHDIIKAEQTARMQGDMSPDIMLSTQTMVMVASKASGLLPDDIQNLSAPDFLSVVTLVKNFLSGWVLPKEEQSEIYGTQS